MDAKTFAAAVARRRPSEVQEACLADAVEHYVSQGQTQQSHVAGCIELAGRFAIVRARPQGNQEMPDYYPFPPTPGLIARSDELTRRIIPTVEQVRQNLFGKTSAPFSSYAETAAWIEQMGEQQDYTIDYRENAEGVYSTTLVVRNQELHQHCMAVRKEIETKYREYTELTGDPLAPLTIIGRFVPYLRPYPNGALWVENFPACTGSPLAQLAEVSQETAEATGFHQHSVVMFILMGTKPLLSPGHVTIRRTPHKKWDIVRVQVSVEINTTDVMEPQLRAIQQVIRRAWGVENTAPISAEELCSSDTQTCTAGLWS